MQPPQTFGMGDQVWILRTTDDLPQGSDGTVVRVAVVPDCSAVHFDRYPWHRLVDNHDLELVAGAHAVGQTFGQGRHEALDFRPSCCRKTYRVVVCAAHARRFSL